MSEKNREKIVNGFGDSSKEERTEKSEQRHDAPAYMSEPRGFSIGELIDRDDLYSTSPNSRKNFKDN